jgi:hypothetical protein
MPSIARSLLLAFLLCTAIPREAHARIIEAKLELTSEGVITLTGDKDVPPLKEIEDGSVILPEAKDYGDGLDFVMKHKAHLKCTIGYWGITHPSKPSNAGFGPYDPDRLFITTELKGIEKGAHNVLRIDDQFAIGFYYGYAAEEKKHMKPDHEEAFKWFLRAAKFGQAKAQYFLGHAYARGKGTDKDEATAAKWYVKSAEQGETEAQVALGFAYLLGKGVPKDEIEAYAYFNIAGSKDEEARKYVTKLEGQMTPSARIAAQQRSRQLLQEFEAKKDSLRQLIEDSKKAREKKGA